MNKTLADSKPRFHVVIPSRYGSSRLPGKPLADIGGKPMIVRVVEQVRRSAVDQIVVATDDQRIVDVVVAAGYAAELTSTAHRSGSDRVMEVVNKLGWTDEAIVINVQGDEPLIPPAVIDQVAEMLHDQSEFQVATLCHETRDPAEFDDPNCVKVVLGSNGRALYFSRARIPFPRDTTFQSAWRHVGIYGYRVAALRRFVELPPGGLETTESLEQLRLLENGIPILVAPAVTTVPGGVDTPADLERVIALV